MLAATVAATVAAVAQGGPGLTTIGPVRRLLFPGLAGYGSPGHVALTLDDGPDPRSTPRFLDLLSRREIRATFFLLGSMAAAAPGLTGEIAAAGHEIGVHGWDHRYLTVRSPKAAHQDLARARDIIADITGQEPAFFRPPCGVLSGGALLAAGRLGLRPLLWTCWGREWTAGATPDSVYSTLMAGLSGGGTVLLHDSDATSPPGSARAALGALPRLLDACADRGLTVGTAAEHGVYRRPITVLPAAQHRRPTGGRRPLAGADHWQAPPVRRRGWLRPPAPHPRGSPAAPVMPAQAFRWRIRAAVPAAPVMPSAIAPCHRPLSTPPKIPPPSTVDSTKTMAAVATPGRMA